MATSIRRLQSIPLIKRFSSTSESLESAAFDPRPKQIFIFITNLGKRGENSPKMYTEAIFALTATFGTGQSARRKWERCSEGMDEGN